MEAEKTHNLLSANWRPRKASDVIQSESKGLRTRGTGREQEKKSWDVPVPPVRQENKNEFLFPLPVVLFRVSMDWGSPTTPGRAIYFTESTNLNDNLIQKHFHRHTQKHCLIWASMAQSSWHIKLTITVIILTNQIDR